MSDPDPLRASLPLFKGQQFWQTTPFNVKVGRSLWTVATDGGYLMALQGQGAKLATKSPEGVLPLLKAKASKPLKAIETEALKQWAGPVPEKRDFDWTGIDEEHWGSILGVCVDRRRLACVLENLPWGMVQIWDATEVMGVMGIGVEAKGFRALVAGLKDGPDPDTPKFESRGKPTSGIDFLDDLPQE